MPPRGRLALSWVGKDKALVRTVGGDDDYEWADYDDPRVREVRLLDEEARVGDVTGLPEDNLLIVGDAIDAMRSLLITPEYARHYAGKVKLVYIDPPFNTKQAFDHYNDSLEHSVWLTMMRDRFILIKRLLADDGSVWVHLDDEEVSYCQVLMDEVFGRRNRLGEVIWRSTDNSNNDAKTFSVDHNTILVYGKNPEWTSNRSDSDESQAGHYSNPDNDPRGPWFDGNPLGSPSLRENLQFDLKSPTGYMIPHPPNGWRWSPETLQEKIDSGEIYFTESGKSIRRRTYLLEQGGLPPSSLWGDVTSTGSNRSAKNEMKRLFPGTVTRDLFKTPKPEKLLRRIIETATQPGDIVLDCFGGSGATAAVAHKLGRKWVTVEVIPDNVDRFTMPRLEKVVSGADDGGISVAEERVPASGLLPAGTSPSDVKYAASVLNVLVAAGVMSELSEEQRKAMASLSRVKKVKRIDWAGGGGFRRLAVHQSAYEVIDGRVVLADWVVGDDFERVVSAQLGFDPIEDPVFTGMSRRRRLAVIDGVVDADVVQTIVSKLDDRETVLIVGKSVTPDAPAALRELSRGSRLYKAPHDLFRRRITK